jgi:predicted ATPase/DNA-binding SARP family transcriptional activator
MMMSNLKLFLLGPPRIEREGSLVEIARRKAIALLAYLAITGESQRRDSLATMFWPDADQSRARGGLRRDLSILNKAIGPGWLVIDREVVALERGPGFWLDVAQFYDNLAACQTHAHDRETVCPACLSLLSEAVSLYRDDFLTGFTLRDSPGFDEWQFFQAESLRQLLATALQRLVQGYSGQENFDQAIIYARRQLSLDPLHEPAHRQLMQLYAWAGQNAAALRQYQLCWELLDQELGLEPEAETIALYERIRHGEFETVIPHPEVTPPPATTTRPAAKAGSAVVTDDEIRVVTVLYAGITVQSEAKVPLEDTALRMNRLHQAIEVVLDKYQARLENILGNNVLAFFGSPHSHEDDPERAVQAALEIRKLAEALNLGLAIGLSTGDVYFGQTQPKSRYDTIVMGPAVTVAERLQAVAGTGQILAGEMTYRRTRRAFRFDSLTLPAAGSAAPQKVYRVVRPRSQPEKSRGIEGVRTRLVGRDEELAKLRTILAGVAQGLGQVVCLTGEAGVGKSRLVAELKRSAAPDSTVALIWLEGRCLEMGLTASYWPFMELFRAYFGWGARDSRQVRANHLTETLQEMQARGDLTAEQVEEMGPLLGNLLSLQFGTAWDNRLTHAGPEQIRHRTFEAIHSFFVALARRWPVVLVFEDIHWADSLSLDLISLLMEAVPHTPLLLLCVYRPDRHHKSWRLATIASHKCPENYTELHLADLTPAQSRQLVDDLLALGESTLPVKDLILAKAQGNPFFLEEMIRSLLDAGVIYQSEAGWQLREAAGPEPVPDSIQSVIMGRVDHLDAELKQVLQGAAIIGRLFSRQILAQIITPAVDLDHALWQLEDDALVYQERTIPEVEYSFNHVLTQETVYQMIPRARRSQLHLQVALAMETHYQDRLERHLERIAFHFDRSDDLERAVAYLLKAGHKARRAYLYDEAIAYFQRVLARLGDTGLAASKAALEWRLSALNGLGQIYFGRGRLDEAEQAFRQALELGRQLALPVAEIIAFYYWLGEVLHWQNRFTERLELGYEGLALLADDTETMEVALMNQTIAAGYNLGQDFARFRQFTYRTAQFIQRLPYTEELRPAYHHIVEAFLSDNDLEQAQTWLQIFEEQARSHHDWRALGETHFLAGTILARTGDLKAGLARERQALELFTKIGDEKHRSWPLINMGGYALQLGDLALAEIHLSQALEATRTVGSKREVAQAYRALGTLFLGQKAYPQAIEALQESAANYRDIGSPDQARALVALGRAHLALGQAPPGRSAFSAALGLISPDSPLLATALSGLEATYRRPGEFRTFCRKFHRENPAFAAGPLRYWYLEPASPATDLAGATSPAKLGFEPLTWHDPQGDCSFKRTNRLAIYAANDRDLWSINHSAPRLMTPVAADFTIQSQCAPLSAEQPAIGGILLWQNGQNFLRLDRGLRGLPEISLEGCLANQNVIIGRGRLPLAGPLAAVWLRLERRGRQIRALCSADGRSWFAVGQVELQLDGPAQAGLYAIGHIDRTIYHGAYPAGTAIRFTALHLEGGSLTQNAPQA